MAIPTICSICKPSSPVSHFFFPLLAPLASVALEAQKSWCHRSASAGEEKGIPLKPVRFSSKIDPKEYPVVSHRPSWKKSWCASREEDHK
jgi:hypothetical protein